MARETDLESGEVKINKTGDNQPTIDPETEIVSDAAENNTENPDATILVGGLKSEKPEGNTPTVGWLVVWNGPGKGISHKISLGRNSIGRGKSCDIKVDHGDSTISKNGTIAITYEHKYHTFTFVNNGSKNPPYINEKAIHTESSLGSGDILEIGDTQLVFIPFCSSERNWS